MPTLAIHGMKLNEKYNKPRRANIMQHLMEYQFKMVGKTMVDTINDDRWRFNWTLTRKQRGEFEKYAIPVLKKVFRFNRTKAQTTFNWFYEHFGLRLKE